MVTKNSINSNIPIEIAKGGTNATTMAITDGVVYFDGTSLVTTAIGTATHVLTSNGAGNAPTFQAASGNVTAASNLTDLAVIRGDGGAKGVKTSTMLIDDNGQMTNPSQPAFLAYLSSTNNNVTGDATTVVLGSVTALTEVFDQNSDFNVNGTFTAPITGKYQLQGDAHIFAGTALTEVEYKIVTSNRNYRSRNNFGSAAVYTTSNSVKAVLADMDAGDTAKFSLFTLDTGGKTSDIFGDSPDIWSYFSGYLVC